MTDPTPNIRALLDGRVSGSYSEWPQLRAEVARVLDELAALRLALLQERERCAKVCEEVCGYTLITQGARNADAKHIRALPDPCDLTEARENMGDQT